MGYFRRNSLSPFVLLISIVWTSHSMSLPAAELSNGQVRARFSETRLESLTDLRAGFLVRFADESFSITVDGSRIRAKDLRNDAIKVNKTSLSCFYSNLQYAIKVTYELKPGWHFVTKQILVESRQGLRYHVNEVESFISAVTPVASEEVQLSARGSWGTLLRYSKAGSGPSILATGVFLLHQNPFNAWKKDGPSIAASYQPEIDWMPAYGPFISDRFCIGLYPLSGRRFPARPVPEWTFVPDYAGYLEGNAQIDMAEADALVECVRAFLLCNPQKSIRVHVPWCENDYQIDVANPDGWEEYARIISRAAEVGCQFTLFTPANSELSSLSQNSDAWGWENLLFFGMGQKLRKGEWDPAKDPVPPSLRRSLDYARSKNIRLVSYSYPSLPFMQDPEWTRWTGGKVGGYNGPDMGLRSFQDWWLGKLVDFVHATGAGGFSFDHWWIAYDNASSKYAQWSGCRRILETLRKRLPDILIDGRQQYMNFGPWTWLAGSYPHPSLTDEQPESFVPFPDLHTDRVSADRQRFAAWTYRMQRFCPPEILPGFMTHQTERNDAKGVMRRDRFRPRDWDVLGWKFSVLSSIGTAPFNHVVNYLPVRDADEFRAFSAEDKEWLRHWLDWTDNNALVLKHLKPIIGPPMIGHVDGTAACLGDYGFVFLFNPNYRRLDAEFVLGRPIGIERGEAFIIEELYPEKGRLIGQPQNGFWETDEVVSLPISGNQAVVLAIKPLPAGAGPLLFNVPGQARIRRNALALSSVTGEAGIEREISVRLPAGTRIEALTINDRPVQFRQNGILVKARVRFAGDEFGRSQPLWNYDPAFDGGVIRASFRIPQRIVDQLRRRREAWPVPYTDDDLMAPWLGSYRLLLYAQIAEPDDSKDISMKIDGQPVPVRKAYNNIYGNNKRTFLGSYADVSYLDAGREHVIEVVVPRLGPGRFQGLFFENVEPEYTSEIAK